MESFPRVLPLSGLEEMLSSSFGFATCVIMDVLSMETRCCTPTATPLLVVVVVFCFFQLLVRQITKALLLQSLELQSSAVRSSIKIPSHSERAVPFPRSSQTRKRRRNISGRSGDPTSAAVTVREGNKASVPHSGSCVSAVVVAGSISPRLLLLLPLRAPAALRTLQYQLRFTVFIQRWRPSCSRRGRAQLSSNNSNTST